MSAAVRRSLASFAVPNFRRYFAGLFTSIAGNWMQIVAELWLILTLTGSGVLVGVATALQFTGILLLGAWGGALADRFDKRRLLMLTQAVMAVPALAMLVLWSAGLVTAPIVLALIAIRGAAMAVDVPLRQSFVIEVVGRGRLVNAVNLNGVLIQGGRIVGPAIAGVIIALWGVGPVFAINVATFGVMIAALSAMDPSQLVERPAAPGRGGVREAIRYVARTPELRLPLLMTAVLGTLGFNFHVILPLLARFSFDGEVTSYSALLVSMAVGAIAGALVNGARGRTGPEIVAAAALAFGLAALLAAAAPTLPLEMLALLLLGAAAVTFSAAVISGLQLASDPTMRGRVMALFSIVFFGSTPIGGPLAGWLGEVASPRAALLLGALAGLGVAAFSIRSRRGRGAQGRGEAPTGELPVPAS